MHTLLRRKVTIVTPFEDLTKAEVMAVCPQKDVLRRTHSCISQRFGDHDGTCYGCVIRRLAGITAGVPDVAYKRDPITDERAEGDNLTALLAFCHDLLVDYESINDFEVEKIERYGKRDLFTRFALDHFAAIDELVRNGSTVRGSVLTLYNSVRQTVGKKALTEGLRAVRSMKPAIDLTRTFPR